MSTVIREMSKMPCKKCLRGSDKRKKKEKKMELKQVCGSCQKLALQIKIYMQGGPITQFLVQALSFLATPLPRAHASLSLLANSNKFSCDAVCGVQTKKSSVLFRTNTADT
jgi:hypothetical protein